MFSQRSFKSLSAALSWLPFCSAVVFCTPPLILISVGPALVVHLLLSALVVFPGSCTSPVPVHFFSHLASRPFFRHLSLSLCDTVFSISFLVFYSRLIFLQLLYFCATVHSLPSSSYLPFVYRSALLSSSSLFHRWDMKLSWS